MEAIVRQRLHKVTINNVVLLDGEPGWNPDTSEYKVGDGATTWGLLPVISRKDPVAPNSSLYPGEYADAKFTGQQFDAVDIGIVSIETKTDDHIARTNNPHAVTKTQVGLGNVDNTADTAKPVSTATQTALNLKANLASPTFTGTVAGITKAMVGLGNVDNTTDANKPISTATQTALNAKLTTPTGTAAQVLNGLGVPKSFIGTTADTALAGNTALLQLGTSSTTAMAGNKTAANLGGLTASAKGEVANKTLAYGGTFKVLQTLADGTVNERVMTMPAAGGGGTVSLFVNPNTKLSGEVSGNTIYLEADDTHNLHILPSSLTSQIQLRFNLDTKSSSTGLIGSFRIVSGYPTKSVFTDITVDFVFDYSASAFTYRVNGATNYSAITATTLKTALNTMTYTYVASDYIDLFIPVQAFMPVSSIYPLDIMVGDAYSTSVTSGTSNTQKTYCELISNVATGGSTTKWYSYINLGTFST